MSAPGDQALTVELFHTWHVQNFLRTVGQASKTLNDALEQIKARGHEIPAVPAVNFVPWDQSQQAAQQQWPAPSLPLSQPPKTPPTDRSKKGSSCEPPTSAVEALQALLAPAAAAAAASSGTTTPQQAATALDASAFSNALATLSAMMSPGGASTPTASRQSPFKPFEASQAALSSAMVNPSPPPPVNVVKPIPGKSPVKSSGKAPARGSSVAGPETPINGASGGPDTFNTPTSRRKRAASGGQVPAEAPAEAPAAKRTSPAGKTVVATGGAANKRRVRVMPTVDWPEPSRPVKPTAGTNRVAALAAAVAAAAAAEDDEADESASTEEESDGGAAARRSPSKRKEGSKAPMHLGTWTEDEKRELIRVVRKLNPCGASDWELVAERLGRGSRGGASAERMYRTLTDPAYHKSSNPHGRRLNPRKGSTPMHVMATYALQKLPDNEGNLSQIGELITNNDFFAKELDWSPRPGTKTYPRWKDALVGCFKPGRYPHLFKTDRKTDGLTVYKLDRAKLRNPYDPNATA